MGSEMCIRDRRYILSEGSTDPVWCRIGASMVENSNGGGSKQDSVVPIDTMAVPNWCLFPAKVLHESSGSFFGSYLLSEGSRYQFGVGLGLQWLRIRMEENRNRTVGYQLTPWPTGVSC